MPKTTAIPGQQDLVEEAIHRCATPGRMLDIGTGAGLAARAFAAAGWKVTATGFHVEDYLGDIGPFPSDIHLIEDVDVCDMGRFPDESFDVVWCAHVIEHVLDTGRALAEIRRILKRDGRLFLSVPPFKHEVVGGHVTPGWNIGILMYVLAVAGLGVSDGSFVRHGYNVFADVGKGDGPLPDKTLQMANGDLETLAALGRFPPVRTYRQGFNGDIPLLNWSWTRCPTEIPMPSARRRTFSGGRMRIAFFVPWVTQGRGGTENVGCMMANSMAARGHAVEVFTFDNHNRACQWELDPEIGLTRLPESDIDDKDIRMMVEVARFDPDLIVGLHMNATFRRYVRCARRLSLPIVLSEHIDPRFPARLKTFDPALRQIVMSGATRIHMLVEAFRTTLPAELQDRVRIIPNTTTPVDDIANAGMASGRRKVITVARLVPRKNIARLIRSFAHISGEAPDWVLTIVGDGPHATALRELAHDLGIASRVEFVGHVANVTPYYLSSHLFVLPSLFEGFPMSMLEAMAHGLPLIGYRVCNGVNEQIEHNCNGLLSTGGFGEGSLSVDMLKLMIDDEARGRMGKASRERYERLYSNEVIHAAWEELFVEAVTVGSQADRPNRMNYLATKLDELTWGDNQLIASSKIEPWSGNG